MLVLGIETSCDETAAAIVRDGTETLSDVIVSQIDVHTEYGGVVPELASRMHSEAISLVLERAFNDADVRPEQIEGIGVTRGPGLIGALLVGIGAAKGMAVALERPICGVNHLHGHLFAIFLERDDVAFPCIGLVVSGGHTSLYYLQGPLEIKLVGRTRDDAAGEAFDKVAKLLGLGYPGGSIIEQQALGVDPGDLKFPRALMEKDNLDFSFSGLKTAVLRRVQQITGVKSRTDIPGSFHPLISKQLSDLLRHEIRIIAAAFQEAVADVLTVKAFMAAEKFGVDRLIVCGGVAANGALRMKMRQEGSCRGIEPVFPSVGLCTDNAAMIASRADTLFSAGLSDDLNFGAMSRW
jgi:N6-L-threonylcarbamoyladenine synthase